MISLAALLVAASKEDSSSVTDSKLKNDEDVLDAYIVWGRGIFSSFLSKGYRGSHFILQPISTLTTYNCTILIRLFKNSKFWPLLTIPLPRHLGKTSDKSS